jgi:hypothetical protein
VVSLFVLVGACALLAPRGARAQARYDASGRRIPDRRGTDEFVALMLTASTYGFRSGTMLDYALGRRPTDTWTYWVAPGVLGAVGLAGAILLERRFPLRRGRAFTVGTGMLLGQVGTLAFELYRRRESFPSTETFTAPITWAGATVGLVTGIAFGHFLDVAPGKAIYVGIGGVGGAFLGIFSCGIARCSTDVGAWMLTGFGVGALAHLATASWLDPPQREMRAMVTGGLLGFLPAAAVSSVYFLRDGAISQDAWVRVSVVGLVGILAGATFGYAHARATRDTAPMEAANAGSPGGSVGGAHAVSIAPTFARDGGVTTLGLGLWGAM